MPGPIGSALAPLPGTAIVERQNRPGLLSHEPSQSAASGLDDGGACPPRRSGRPLPQSRVRAAPREVARGQDLPARGLDQGRAGGPALRHDPRGIRRRRRHVRPRGGHQPRLQPRRHGRLRRAAAFRHRRALHLALRHRGAEEALAAQARQRRDDRRHRHERARRRLRPAAHPHHRGEEGQPLRPQRLEDLHHQRPARRPDRRRRQDRSAARAPRASR